MIIDSIVYLSIFKDMISRILSKSSFRFSEVSVPRVDLTRYLNKSLGWEQDCKEAANLMRKFGLCYAFDPRVNHEDNDKFQDLMQRYFEVRSRQYDEGIKNIDVSP